MYLRPIPQHSSLHLAHDRTTTPQSQDIATMPQFEESVESANVHPIRFKPG